MNRATTNRWFNPMLITPTLHYSISSFWLLTLAPTLFAGTEIDDRFENAFAVIGAENRLARALGVGHQAKDVAALGADAGNVVEKTVGVRCIGAAPAIVAVTQDHLPVDRKSTRLN